MKWGILATGTIAKKFADTIRQMGAEGELVSGRLPPGRERPGVCRRLRHPEMV